MDATNRSRHMGVLGVAIGLAGLLLAGCGGGKSGSSTGPTTASGNVRIEGRVVSASTAKASGARLLAWIETVLSPREAEAQGVPNCTVTAPGATSTVTDGQGRFVLVNVPTSANGTVTLTFNCPPNVTGQLTLGNLPPNAMVSLEVDVRPGEVKVRVREDRPSPNASRPSQPSPPSQPSSSKHRGRG